jgi:hypothetical protein
MKNFLLGVIVAAVIIGGGFAVKPAQQVHAQTSTAPYAMLIAAPVGSMVASCPSVVSGQTQRCWVNDGDYVSSAGAAWACVPGTGPKCPPSTATGGVTSLTINNLTKQVSSSGNIAFTLTSGAPAVSIQSITPSATSSAPAITPQ